MYIAEYSSSWGYMLMTKLMALALLAVLVMPARAQNLPMEQAAAPVCPRDAEPIPLMLAGWSSKTPLDAATDAASLAKAVVMPGTAYTLSLAETPMVAFPVRPSHPGGSVSHSGLVRFTVARAGTYRVAIGSGAWLDVVRDTTSLESVGHGHGPNCSGIRKMVDFALQPGTYTVQIAGNGAASIPLLIARLN